MVEQLTKNNTSLMTKLSDAMKINLEVPNKLNLKAAQIQYTKVKLLTGKSKRMATFERNLDPKVYCWTHGFIVIKRHSSHTCSTSASGHQRTASRKISWEKARQVIDTVRWGG